MLKENSQFQRDLSATSPSLNRAQKTRFPIHGGAALQVQISSRRRVCVCVCVPWWCTRSSDKFQPTPPVFWGRWSNCGEQRSLLRGCFVSQASHLLIWCLLCIRCINKSPDSHSARWQLQRGYGNMRIQIAYNGWFFWDLPLWSSSSVHDDSNQAWGRAPGRAKRLSRVHGSAAAEGLTQHHF